MQSIEITDKNIKSFERVARKYGVDFALKRKLDDGKYIVFFKARDTDALNAAFNEYAFKSLKVSKSKPSIIKKLNHFKEVAKNLSVDKVKNRDKGEIEL